MNLSRQNSDSGENIGSFQRSLESFPNKKSNDQTTSESTPESIFQELEFLKRLSKQCIDTKEDTCDDNELRGLNLSNVPVLNQRKKLTKANKSGRYLNPVLNELDFKNRKIDKIVENLKCNQLKTQEMNTPQPLSIPQVIGTHFHNFR
jgi:hypothetical protein